MPSARLVSFEGGDGAGKTAVAQAFARQLRDLGYRVTLIAPKRPCFRDPFLRDYTARFARIIWETSGPEPRERLDDMHWVHLSAAWYGLVDRHLVRPALAGHDVVVLDSWYHKLIARFRLKPGPAAAEMERCFRPLSKPGRTYLLDVSPTAAAARKTTFGYSETGNLDGLSGVTRANFILYQGRVRQQLRALASANGWVELAAERGDAPETAEAAVALWRQSLSGRPSAAAPGLDVSTAAARPASASPAPRASER